VSTKLGKTPWWLWLTVLSLDAPIVSLVWQAMFAQVLQVHLHLHHILLLGMSVWLAYAGDRWIEAWSLNEGTVQTHRHGFALRWRWPLFTLWCGVLLCALVIAFRTLTKTEWSASLTMLALTLAYLLSHQWLHRAHLWRLPKEICVAIIVTCGAALYPATLGPGSLPVLMIPVLSYSLLALCNCSLISLWEREVDTIHRRQSLALQHRAIAGVIGFAPWTLCGACIIGSLVSKSTIRPLLVAAALGAALLGLVHLRHGSLGRMKSRVLADLVLLTPLLLLLQ